MKRIDNRKMHQARASRRIDVGVFLRVASERVIGDARQSRTGIRNRDDERAVVGKIKLWIDQSSWMPRRQEFSSTGNGLTTTLDYNNMARNLRLNPDLFDDDWPRGTETIKH